MLGDRYEYSHNIFSPSFQSTQLSIDLLIVIFAGEKIPELRLHKQDSPRKVSSTDTNIMFSEALSDFSAQWCQDLLNSPDLVNLSTEDRRPQPISDKIVPQTLFTETLKSDTTIRAMQILRAKHADIDGLSPPVFILMSLGNGLESHVGILHGGMMAAMMDYVTSYIAVFTAGTNMVTAELNVRYRKSVSLPGVVLCRAKAIKREGRRVLIQGTIESGTGTIFCEGDSICVLRKEKL